jgi:primosomal protein N' (replication factor Y) (superfamily II helicase)
MISKIRNQFLFNILIKIPKGKVDLQILKDNLKLVVSSLLKEKEHRNTKIVLDVDPV